jgi:hypothetical protein
LKERKQAIGQAFMDGIFRQPSEGST